MNSYTILHVPARVREECRQRLQTARFEAVGGPGHGISKFSAQLSWLGMLVEDVNTISEDNMLSRIRESIFSAALDGMGGESKYAANIVAAAQSILGPRWADMLDIDFAKAVLTPDQAAIDREIRSSGVQFGLSLGLLFGGIIGAALTFVFVTIRCMP